MRFALGLSLCWTVISGVCGLRDWGRSAPAPPPPHDVAATCYYNNKIFQATRELTPAPAAFLELWTSVAALQGKEGKECTDQRNAHKCAMDASLGVKQDCAWCMDFVQTSVGQCIKRDDVDYWESQGLECAPHASREDQANHDEEKRVGKSFSQKWKDGGLVPAHHAAWGHIEFCTAVEALFGATKELEAQPALKKRFKNLKLRDIKNKETAVSAKFLDDGLKEIWDSKHPGETFVVLCTNYLGEICRHECMLLSAIFDEAARPGIEAFAGAPDQYTSDWELAENGYLGSAMGLVENKELRGAPWIPSIRVLENNKKGPNKEGTTIRKLHYRMWADDCVRCLTESVCMPECLVAETPCGSEALNDEKE